MNIEQEFEEEVAVKAVHTVKTVEAPPKGRIHYSDLHGGEGGTEFLFIRQDEQQRYIRVKKLEVSIENQVSMRGIRVTFADDTQQTAGEMANFNTALGRADIYPITFAENESITEATIYECPVVELLKLSPRVNGLAIMTDGAAEAFDHKAGFRPVFNTPLEVKSYNDPTFGVLVGIRGRSGAAIDQLGLILELPLVDVAYILENVKYKLERVNLRKEPPLRVQGAKARNNSNATLNQTLAVSFTHSDTKSWSNTWGGKVGLETTIEGGIPLVTKGAVKVNVEADFHQTIGQEVTETIEDQWEASIEVPPHTQVQMIAVVKMAEIRVPYEARLTKVKSDGTKEFGGVITGEYKGVCLSDYDVRVKNLKHKAQQPKKQKM